MSARLYLSRARLRAGHGEALSSIAPILLPEDDARRVGLAHRLVWLLFQGRPDAERDFLWRDEGDGHYMILSPRPPQNPNDLFDLGTKPFEPELSVGDDLRFMLRANPTVARKTTLPPDARATRSRGKRIDVVMDSLSKLPKSERARQRDYCVSEAGRQWLGEQGIRAGFEVLLLQTSGYSPTDVSDHERRDRRDRATVSFMEFSGVIRVSDPATFLTKLAKGFGSAKAFGGGLMLIRRA